MIDPASDRAIHAVLFDFSGTLFRLEANDRWDALFTTAEGSSLDADERSLVMTRMTAPVGSDVPMDAEQQRAWERRDLDPAMHRAAYLHVLESSGVTDAAARDALYALAVDPDGWTPYPDTGEVLARLHARGVRVGVLSNIAFDARAAFASRGWDRFVGAFVLSFEVGVVKPDLAIFEIAMRELGVTPEHTLMVGDSAHADGAATELGCAFTQVDPLPTAQRPTALLDGVRAYVPIG
ncbi:HAD-IA family hydrolase [Rhodococcus sp. HNM0569]|uniref:HAD family hydrolase n=1 Tax=Rhodococcus sp. HNM0569 TaxID=2716340 RepID=UPI00146AA8E4|nr:HAD-IA family hydrolase [Rhodococcus sp. HNM0569]NLU84222.1 HAD-IA family hydrolase [Rhodococcus sp. HNM0569]